MKQYNPMTPVEFFEAWNNGQRYFQNIDFEEVAGFSHKDFAGITFEGCFLYLDFRNSNLTNAQFISCNIKEIDLRNADLTNALIRNCLVESAMFSGAVVNGFRFIDNYYYGLTVGQKEFDEKLMHGNAYILTKELTEQEYLNTMSYKMADVTETAEPVIDIWKHVKDLVYEHIVAEYVLTEMLVEKVYRNDHSTYDHVLLPTASEHLFIVIIVNIEKKVMEGYYRLDLAAKYAVA